MEVTIEQNAAPPLLADAADRAGFEAAAPVARQPWTAPSVLPVAVDEITRAGPDGTTDGGIFS